MFITQFIDYSLFISCLFILIGSLFLTFKTRFIQLRFFPELYKMLKASFSRKGEKDMEHTILPHRALFTAMSTTLGISTIVGPVIAINLGGPGALFGFLLTSFFGAAATYLEVSLSVQYRKKLEDGSIMGGPMQYLKQILSPGAAKWYAACCLILMTAWSAAQANQLAAVLDSPHLGSFRIPSYISGILIVVLVILTLRGGIKRIGSFSAKLVPLMFLLYLGSSLWILACNLDKLVLIFNEMVQSALAPRALASGAIVGGIVSTMRWGVFKGTQATEAGVGTQAIPHSMAETQDPDAQGKLAMISTFTAGIVAFLSGCVALITKTWLDPELPLGMSMVVASFNEYFSYFGVAIVTISSLLFGFGTILGNSYNGSQCFGYFTENKKSSVYLGATAVMIFLGCVLDAKFVWSFVDIFVACMALPHMTALMIHAQRQSKELKLSELG